MKPKYINKSLAKFLYLIIYPVINIVFILLLIITNNNSWGTSLFMAFYWYCMFKLPYLHIIIHIALSVIYLNIKDKIIAYKIASMCVATIGVLLNIWLCMIIRN